MSGSNLSSGGILRLLFLDQLLQQIQPFRRVNQQLDDYIRSARTELKLVLNGLQAVDAHIFLSGKIRALEEDRAFRKYQQHKKDMQD